MNAQRYTPAELDEIAEQCRDEAIRVRLLGPSSHTDHETYYRKLDSLVGLARLLREDAERLRRNARSMQTADRSSAS